ncbi:hypothetical protein L6164_007204 [Bauhinia variegata]|uniref:Uncharacterized protein n=1 Tax=Bauhinia variegata TaxID=167791 RepID=A0ACB9PWA0_BAUVA|nr:hypothetical protein L6164_007204 [Bauhinia variegata]
MNGDLYMVTSFLFIMCIDYSFNFLKESCSPRESLILRQNCLHLLQHRDGESVFSSGSVMVTIFRFSGVVCQFVVVLPVLLIDRVEIDCLFLNLLLMTIQNFI